MQSSPAAAGAHRLPDGIVKAMWQASNLFVQLQSSHYETPAASTSSALQVDLPSMIMRTKTLLPQREQGVMDARHVLPSTWSERYRGAVEKLPDAPSKRLWGLVSTVLRLLEESGNADNINASAAIVAWMNHFSGDEDGAVLQLEDKLQQLHPLDMTRAEVEDLGSTALASVENAFLTGHFERAAGVMDALLIFLRRASPAALSAGVETAIANVKRLLINSFHDPDTHARCWRDGANAELRESRNVLTQSSSGAATQMPAVDALVGDLCATCVDLLVLITGDATRMWQRCEESRRSTVDFLVAVCAIMEPYAELARLAEIFAEYATSSDWVDEAVLAVLSAGTLPGMVDAMAVVAQVAESAFPWDDAAGGGDDVAHDRSGGDVDEDEDEDDDAASDTVSLSEMEAATTPPTTAQACRFTLACMAAHVADLCAPVAAASTAADMPLTFTRNNLVVAYAELFAYDARTWRVAGLYACYSPLSDPSFVAAVVEAAAVLAVDDAQVYTSLCAFFQATWNPHSAHQSAVRAKLEAALPDNPTVAKWWSAVDFTYAETCRKVHQYMIVMLFHRGRWARAACLAVETNLTVVLQSILRRLMQSADALASEELYAIGCAALYGFMATENCASAEVVRYLCAASTLAKYRQKATAVHAALQYEGHSPTSSTEDAPSSEEVVEAVVLCLQAIEAALQYADECDMMLHPATTFTLVEHGASLLRTLRQKIQDPVTRDTSESMHVTSALLPRLVEAYQLSAIHFGSADPLLEERSRALGEQLAVVHQTCL